jgi:phosphoribosylformylglycinamidine cyclo-ligase
VPGGGFGVQYRDAGVDIDRATGIVRGIAALARPTWGPRVLSEIGGFGGLFDAGGLGGDAVLVASMDGVGTKLAVARAAGRWDGVGADLVHHSVNDILVQGARPLFFLDYVGAGRLEPEAVLAMMRGMASACAAHGCALLGGETAEMPGTYAAGDYDLVGTIIGLARRDAVLTGSRVAPGDEVWGLASTGLHTNGYSLARRVLLEPGDLDPAAPHPALGTSVYDALLAVHRSYFEPLWPLIEAQRLHALAHLTGGGFVDNIPRVLPAGTSVEIDRRTWDVPPLFRLIQARGGISDAEMARVFNLGIGMVVVLAPGDAPALAARCPDARRIGRVVAGERQVHLLP